MATKTERASRAILCSNYSTAFMASSIKTRSTKATSRFRAKNAFGWSRCCSTFSLASIVIEITRITIKITRITIKITRITIEITCSVAKTRADHQTVSKGGCVKIQNQPTKPLGQTRIKPVKPNWAQQLVKQRSKTSIPTPSICLKTKIEAFSILKPAGNSQTAFPGEQWTTKGKSSSTA